MRRDVLARPLALSTVSALALSLAAPAMAQDFGVIELDEITISANLVPTEIQRSGASVSVIERDEIEASGATQVGDLLARLPGVSMTSDGGPGARTTLRIRGAGPSYAAVYVDGIRVDDPTSTEVQTDFGHMTLDDIERIEVLRGSQSAPYGGSAVAGVINITTTRPQRDGFSHSVFAEGGSYRSMGAGYTMGYRDDRLEASLSLTHRRSEGFTAWEGVPGTPGFDPDAEADGFESTRLSFSARYRASDALTLGIAGFAQRSRNDYDPWDEDLGPFGAIDPNAPAEFRWRQYGLRLSGEYDTGATLHLLGASVYSIRRDNYEFGVFEDRFDGQRLFAEYQGVRDISPTMTLVWGADAMRESATTSSIPDGRSTTTLGAFGQALWSPDDRFDLSATARFDNNSDFGNFLTGRLTAAWQVTPDTTLRAAAGRGFRAPSLDERLGAYPQFDFFGNPDLEPETSLSAEIGVDHRFNGGANVSATLFLLDTDNLIDRVDCPRVPPDFDCAPGTFGTLDNFAGTSRRYGLELSGRLPLTDRLTMTGAYTFTDARNPGGDPLPRVPRHDLSLGLDAELAARLRGSVSVQHVAGRPSETDFATFTQVAMPDYTLVNASLRYAVTDSADIYLRAENLLDTQYQHTLGYATPGRSFHLGVAARF